MSTKETGSDLTITERNKKIFVREEKISIIFNIKIYQILI